MLDFVKRFLKKFDFKRHFSGRLLSLEFKVNLSKWESRLARAGYRAGSSSCNQLPILYASICSETKTVHTKVGPEKQHYKQHNRTDKTTRSAYRTNRLHVIRSLFSGLVPECCSYQNLFSSEFIFDHLWITITQKSIFTTGTL